MKKALLIDAISALLLILFLYTGISKLMDYDKFHAVLSSSPLLSPASSILAWLLPLAEIIIALLLFFPRTRSTGLRTSLFLLLALTGYLIFMIVYSPKLPCSCGGVLNKMGWKQHILFNLFFIALNLIAVGGSRIYELLNFLRRQGMPKT
jgi:uncharacterized membrane protein YphA (DoxX/SURF4 family)